MPTYSGAGGRTLDKYEVWRKPDNPYVRHIWFDSIDNIIECIKQGETDRWKGGYGSGDYPWKLSDGQWAGAKSMPEALEYLQYGWPEVADAIYIQDAALAVGREIENEFDMYRDVSGGAVDVGAYLTGIPENMINYQIHPRPKKTVKILVNVCSSGSTNPKTIIQRGHTITSICDYLEKCGYRVRVDVADTAYGYYNGKRSHWTLAFCAKDFNQPLDFGRIGFMLGSPAMLRRIFFGVEASSLEWGLCYGQTFGSVAPVHVDVGNEYDYVFDYFTPINIPKAQEMIDYIVKGTPVQKDITGYYDVWGGD
jgi:hypothetical protein